MYSGDLKEDLNSIKSNLQSLTDEFSEMMNDLAVREDKWVKMDKEANHISVNITDIIKINVGGDRFATRAETLLKVKDTLFYKILISKKFDTKKEIFFDRFSTYFGCLLDYLRYGKFNIKRFKKPELEEILIEAEYFEMAELVKIISYHLKDILPIRFECTGEHRVNSSLCGTQTVEDLIDTATTKGICSTSPGMIMLELNDVWEIEEIDVAGWTGNTSIWPPTSGANASISTSLDNKTYKTVGCLPSNFNANVQKVKLARSKAKFIKFDSKSLLGLGYIHFKKMPFH